MAKQSTVGRYLIHRLESLGVTWCLASGQGAAHERNLMHNAGTAVAFGLSQKAAILAVGDNLTRLVLRAPPQRAAVTLTRLLARIARALERPRPGRSWPRRSLQPQTRWTPSGRRGGG